MARSLLRALVPEELRDAVEGDLEEGFRRRASRAPGRARRWYWRQVLGMPALSLRRRVRRLRRRRGGRRVDRTTGVDSMGGMARDVRVALRTLARRPAFAVVTVLTLALSIGPATLLFSVTEGVLLRPLPYADAGRLVNLYLLNEAWRDDADSEAFREAWDRYFPGPRHVEAWKRAPVHLASLGAYGGGWGVVSVGDIEESTLGIRVDEGVFPTLGVEPLLGRLPTPEEYRDGSPVAVLRHEVWSGPFGGAADVLGRTFRYGDVVYSVIGVMPSDFYFPDEGEGGLWIPYPPDERSRAGRAVGRLAPGATAAEASAALDEVARRLGEEDPALAGFGARAVPRLDEVVRHHRSGLLLLLGTSLIVVLVACVNLANLVLARGARRRGELAVRTALGASGGSVARAVFVEVAIVAVVGGGAGILGAWALLDPFVAALDASVGGLPRSDGIALDAPVLLFSVGAMLGAALLAGLFPALGAALRSPADALRAGRRGAGAGRSGRAAQRALLVVQAALAALLLAGAGLLVRSYGRIMAIDPGFDTEGVAYLTVPVDEGSVAEGPERADAVERVRRRLEALAGVTTVAFAGSLPGVTGLFFVPVREAGRPPEDARQVAASHVSADYFRAMGIPVLAGRTPASGRREEGAPVAALLSESLARLLFGSDSALGRRVAYGLEGGALSLEVVGVVADSRFALVRDPEPHLYVLLDPARPGTLVAVLKTGGDPGALVSEAREAVEGVLAGARVERLGTLPQALSSSVRSHRLRAGLMGALAAIAGALAVVGIAGVVIHFLTEQTHEVAVRLSLGARPRVEVARVLRHALLPVLAGLAVGLGAALAVSRVMEAFLYRTSPLDPLTYAVVALLLLGVAALSAWLPARRAAAVDPVRVLSEA